MTNTLVKAAFGRADLGGPGCWEWQGPLTRGYGRTDYQGATRIPHRLAYEAFYGPIPEGLTIDHLCRNRACVRPSHLEAVPNKVNCLRGFGPTAENARKSLCPKGHKLSSCTENGRLRRRCKECPNSRYATNPAFRAAAKRRAHEQRERERPLKPILKALDGLFAAL